MPELPEVQTIANELNAAGMPGHRIRTVSVTWPRSIANISPRVFSHQLSGCTIRAVRRRAKYIIFDLDQRDKTLLIHLRMSGRLRLCDGATVRDRHEHVCIVFSDGSELRLHDTRKFARLYLCKSADIVTAHLGPEPLDPAFTLAEFRTMLAQRSRMLKPLLLDQRFIAGLGNIYVDEALWEAGLHPCRRADTLTQKEGKQLFSAIPRVLIRGLRNMGTSLGTGEANFFSVAGRRGGNSANLRVFRKTGLPCPRCGVSIKRIVVGQRSTHICPACQR